MLKFSTTLFSNMRILRRYLEIGIVRAKNKLEVLLLRDANKKYSSQTKEH